MQTKIIRAKDLKEQSFGDTKVTNVLNTEEISNLSLAIIRKVGDDIKLGLDKESDVIYYVLDGDGICVIEGKQYKIKKGDAVFLPKGTKYKNLKGLNLLAIASPRYDRNKRVYFE